MRPAGAFSPFYFELQFCPVTVAEENRANHVARLSVTVSPEDYGELLTTELRKYRKQMHLPGFRPGTIPMSVVKKRVGRPLLYQEVSRLSLEALFNHLEETQTETFGQPVLVQSDLGQLEPFDAAEYTLDYDIGLKPGFELDFQKFKTVPKYAVEITDEDVAQALEIQRYKHGEKLDAQAVQADDVFEITGNFRELSAEGKELENGLNVTLDFLTLHYRDFQSQLVGLKVGDSVQTTFAAYFPDDQTARNVLQITPEVYHELQAKPLKFEIEAIKTVTPKAVDRDFYLGLGGVPAEGEEISEATVKAKFREQLEKAYADRAEGFFHFQLQNALLDQANLDFPRPFLERMMLQQVEDAENIRELYQKHPGFVRDLQVYLSHQRLAELHPELEADPAQLEDFVRENVSKVLGDTLPQAPAKSAEETDGTEVGEEPSNVEPALPNRDELLNTMVDRLMHDEKYLEQRKGELRNRNIFNFLAQHVPVDAKTVSKAEFDAIYAGA